MECIKTGVMVEVCGRVWRGDLFELTGYYLLNCNHGAIALEHPVAFIHASFRSWELMLQKEKVIVFRENHLNWFDYEGKEI